MLAGGLACGLRPRMARRDSFRCSPSPDRQLSVFPTLSSFLKKERKKKTNVDILWLTVQTCLSMAICSAGSDFQLALLLNSVSPLGQKLEKPSGIATQICLGVTSQFFPGILLSRGPPKTLGKWLAFERNDG